MFYYGACAGDYRYLLHKPRTFSYRLVRYSDPNDDALVATDLELLQQNRGHGATRGPGGGGGGGQPPQAQEAAGAEPSSSAAAAQSGGDERAGGEGGSTAAAGAGGDVVVEGEGPLVALSLRFVLPSSCYATMLVRRAAHGMQRAGALPCSYLPGAPACLPTSHHVGVCQPS